MEQIGRKITLTYRWWRGKIKREHVKRSEVVMNIVVSTAITAFVSPELLDLVQATCNYEASGDGVVLVDTDQLENTSDTSGQIKTMLEFIRQAMLEKYQSLGSEATKANYTDYIILRA